jgi:hypothetical protein
MPKKKSKDDNTSEGQSEGGEVAHTKIPLRSFNLKPTLHLKNLPLVLTRYNKPIARLTSFA